MFDRILQTFKHFNDSDAFDCSFEIKNIMEIETNQVKEKSAFNKQKYSNLNPKIIITPNNSANDIKNDTSSESSESNMSNEIHSSDAVSEQRSPILTKCYSEFKPIKSYSCQDVSFTRHSSVKKVEKASSIMFCSEKEESEEDLILHPPLVPIFKLTPTKQSKPFNHGSYHRSVGDIAKFLQSSFHAKQARISRLICTSNNNNQSLDRNDEQKVNIFSNIKYKNDKILKKCHLNNVTNTRIYTTTTTTTNDHVELNGNHFLYRRGWLGQTSLRSLPSQKQNQQFDKSNIYRSASMTTSSVVDKQGAKSLLEDNDVEQQINDQHHVQNASNEIICNRRLLETDKKNQIDQRVQRWAQSFENLLDDNEGLKAFAAFLRSEYSGENLYFWTACKRYSVTEKEKDRINLAKEIYEKHLSNGATEPVNVDSAARNITEINLNSGNKEMFATAQKQVFNLMKFDSYSRFIRSDLYKACLSAEKRKQSLPLSNENLDERLLTVSISTNNSTKLKKSASNAEDRRRRKSLLPWYRKTIRSKSRERSCSEELSENVSTRTCFSHDGTHFANLQPSKIPVMKHDINRKYCLNGERSFHSTESSNSISTPLEHLSNVAVSSLCRVQFVDGATTMLQTKLTETVGNLIERSLEKRGIHYNTFEVFIKGTRRSIDLLANSLEIAGREVEVEQRIAFKLDLPDRKVISVKSKPNKLLIDVIKPILQKYNYDVERFIVVEREIHYNVDLMQNITTVDGLRLQIVPIASVEKPLVENYNYQNDEITNTKCTTALPPIQMLISKQAAKVATSRRQKYGGTMPLTPAANVSKQLPEFNINKLTKSTEEKNNSSNKVNIPPSRTKYSTSASQNTNKNNNSNKSDIIQPNIDVKMPIIAKLKAGVQLHVPERRSGNQDKIATNNTLKFNVSQVLEEFKQKVDSSESEGLVLPHQIYISKATLNSAENGPPPLPPKPKIVPTKPSNWGVYITDTETSHSIDSEVQSHRVSV